MDKKLKEKIQKKLNEKITFFSLKGDGMCNHAYYIETAYQKYIVKIEKNNVKNKEQNNLIIEAHIIKKINNSNSKLPVPKIIFISNSPKMYCYEYIEGKTMKESWVSLSEKNKIKICKELGKFHATLSNLFSEKEAKKIGVEINKSMKIEKEVENEIKNFIDDKKLPKKYIILAKEAYKIFQKTSKLSRFGFIHNDSHHKNIIINNGKLKSVIDYGDAEYGNLYNEFIKYIQDYPQYYEIILTNYEHFSKNKLSRKRILSQAILYSLDDIQDDYYKNNEQKRQAEITFLKCKKWLKQINN